MTSNLGTADLRKANVGFAKADEAVTYERMKEKVNDALKQHFRPEFLNRIDEVIVFHELSQATRSPQIVDLMIKRVAGQLEGQGLGLELTQAAKVLPRREGLRPDARRPAAAPGDPAPGRGPAVREASSARSSAPARSSSSTPRTTPRSRARSGIVFRSVEGFEPPSIGRAGRRGPRRADRRSRRRHHRRLRVTRLGTLRDRPLLRPLRPARWAIFACSGRSAVGQPRVRRSIGGRSAGSGSRCRTVPSPVSSS